MQIIQLKMFHTGQLIKKIQPIYKLKYKRFDQLIRNFSLGLVDCDTLSVGASSNYDTQNETSTNNLTSYTPP